MIPHDISLRLNSHRDDELVLVDAGGVYPSPNGTHASLTFV